MSITPFEHPFLSGLFGEEEVSRLFEAEADVEAMLLFESALAESEAELKLIPPEAASVIYQACANLNIDWDDIKSGTGRDGVVVPSLIKQLRTVIGDPYAEFVHFGATSQDVIDTSLVLRLKKTISSLKSSLSAIVQQLDFLIDEFGPNELMGRTRMQNALPISVSLKLQNWVSPLRSSLISLTALEDDLLQVQFGGAVGKLEKLGDLGQPVKDRLAEKLNLGSKSDCWHTNRQSITNFANWLSLLSGSLGKIGQDIVLMAQTEVGEIQLAKGGTSSAMPHKDNPIHAETLIALGRYNAVQVSAMHQSLLHENERSGASWSLEWLILPQMIMASATGLKLANELFKGIENIGIKVL